MPLLPVCLLLVMWFVIVAHWQPNQIDRLTIRWNLRVSRPSYWASGGATRNRRGHRGNMIACEFYLVPGEVFVVLVVAAASMGTDTAIEAPLQ